MRAFPVFTDAQVSALEELYPQRCMLRNESVEDHLRYAGMCQLIGSMRANVIGNTKDIELSPEEDEAIDIHVEAIAAEQQGKA